MKYGRQLLFFGMPSAYGKRVWVWSKREGASGFYGWRVSAVQREDVPKPFILCWRGSRTFPVSRTPHLLVPPDSLACLLRSGEQIPQVSVILRPIRGNVHGDSLKPSELI